MSQLDFSLLFHLLDSVGNLKSQVPSPLSWSSGWLQPFSPFPRSPLTALQKPKCPSVSQHCLWRPHCEFFLLKPFPGKTKPTEANTIDRTLPRKSSQSTSNKWPSWLGQMLGHYGSVLQTHWRRASLWLVPAITKPPNNNKVSNPKCNSYIHQVLIIILFVKQI